MAGITLVLNDAEQQAFHQLLDISLRNAGMNAYSVVSHFVGLISNAAQTGSKASDIPDGAQHTAAQTASSARAASPGPVPVPNAQPSAPAKPVSAT